MQLTESWNWTCPTNTRIQELPLVYCGVGTPWNHASIKGVIWGDSHSEHTAPLIDSIAADYNASLFLYKSCPPFVSVDRIIRDWPDDPNYTQKCTEDRTKIVAYLRNHLEINLVVLAASWAGTFPLMHEPNSKVKSEAEGLRLFKIGIAEIVDEIALPGRVIAVVGDVPQWEFDPIPCALANERSVVRRACRPDQLTIRRGRFETLQRGEYEAIRALSNSRSDVVAVLPGDALCKGDHCQVSINGDFLYRDSNHLRRNLKASTKRQLNELIGMKSIFEHAELTPASEAAERRGSKANN